MSTLPSFCGESTEIEAIEPSELRPGELASFRVHLAGVDSSHIVSIHSSSVNCTCIARNNMGEPCGHKRAVHRLGTARVVRLMAKGGA